MSKEKAPGPGLRRNGRERLARLLGEMLERPDGAPALAAEIDRDFGEERAILVLDMSGFARTTERDGIIAFLLIIERMKRIALPAVEAHGGILVKTVADNLFALFETVEAAADAATAMLRGLPAPGGEPRFEASVGIGWGRILNVDEEDLFGHEVNLASKLGEEVAGPGVILLTEAAASRLPGRATVAGRVRLAGLDLDYHRLA